MLDAYIQEGRLLRVKGELEKAVEVYAVAEDNGSEIILDSLTLTLDESFNDAFIVVEKEESSATGYKITLFDQSEL